MVLVTVFHINPLDGIEKYLVAVFLVMLQGWVMTVVRVSHVFREPRCNTDSNHVLGTARPITWKLHIYVLRVSAPASTELPH